MNALMDLSRKRVVKRSEDGKFRLNLGMTEKTLPSGTRISSENVERTKQVSYEHYDLLLRNTF